MVENTGGFTAQLAGIEDVSAYHGDNYELLVHRFFKSDRATMLALTQALELEATSQDRSLLDALGHALAYCGCSQDKPNTRHGRFLKLGAGPGELGCR